uniref:Uncharacterized protein n=1 Tax=Globisporangium ultimum (strain ATCC 200006 / CBS 805.95 / DAOM BR144) TaxID=431595 RepID=K3WZJ1_GLOUD
MPETAAPQERASQAYDECWYFAAATVVETLYVFVNTLIFTADFYPLVDFPVYGAAVLFWLHQLLLMLYHAYTGQTCFLFPAHKVFNPPTSSIPSGHKRLHYNASNTYMLSIAAAFVFADCPSDASYDPPPGQFANLGSEFGCQPLWNVPTTLH